MINATTFATFSSIKRDLYDSHYTCNINHTLFYGNVFIRKTSLSMCAFHFFPRLKFCCWKTISHFMKFSAREKEEFFGKRIVFYEGGIWIDINFFFFGGQQRECVWRRKGKHGMKNSWGFSLTEKRFALNDDLMLLLRAIRCPRHKNILGNTWKLALRCW
jgi:hypothetical protein